MVGSGSGRERLIEAMAAVAARHGYGGATVARVIEQAGVSRATFYQHFADRADCFRAAVEEAISETDRGFAWLTKSLGREPSAREALRFVLDGVSSHPAPSRLLLIEGLAAPPAAGDLREQWLTDLAGRIERGLDAAGSLDICSRAVLGGIGGVLAMRVFRGEAGRVPDLLDPLLGWVDAYSTRSDGGGRPATDWFAHGEPPKLADRSPEHDSPPRLPRGKSALSPARVASEHRDRVLAAVARLSREVGYAQMTVASIVSVSGVTRESFYALFRSKEDAFLATQAHGLEESVSITAGKFFGEASWSDRAWSGLEAMFGYIAEQPDLICVDMIESYAAGPAAIKRSFENRMAYTLFLEDGYRQRPEAEALPRISSEAISGALMELIRRQVRLGRSEQILETLPEAAYLTLAPFIGPAAALELVREKCRTRLELRPADPATG